MSDFVMIDLSCWIKFLRNSDKRVSDLVQFLIEKDKACLCGIIELEIVQGIKSKKQSKLVEDLFEVLRYYEFQRNDFINAGNRIRKLRMSGITLAPSDVLIAEICLRNSITIFSLDKDFNHIQDLKKYKF